MLARILFSLVLGLLMYVPRPTPPRGDGPGNGPPSPDDLPPGGDAPPPTDDPPLFPRPDDPPIRPVPMPTPGWPGRPGGSYPSVPPTPPPGHEGPWPPGGERPDVPPTPPPGHDGPWPGDDGIGSIRDQIRELLLQVRELLRRDDAPPASRHPSTPGVMLLGGAAVDEGTGTTTDI